MAIFASRYPGLMVTWPKGSDQVVKFHNGRFKTEDEALTAHLRSLKGVYEMPDRKESEKATGAPAPKGENVIRFLEEAVSAGVVTKNEKRWYFYGEEPIGNSQKNCTAFLKKRPEVRDAIAAAMTDK